MDSGEFSLSADALEALQGVLGTSAGQDAAGDDIAKLLAMMSARRGIESSDEEEDEEEEEEVGESETFESHAEYYRRLFPERYTEEDKDRKNVVEEPVALVTMDDTYVQDLILKAFKSRGNWKVLTKVPAESHGEGEFDRSIEPYHFHWGEYEHIEWYSPRFSSEDILASCYYNRKGLIRKGNLAYILEKWAVKNPSKAPLAPRSYILTVDPKKDGETDDQFDKLFEEAYEKLDFPEFRTVESRDMTTEEEIWIFKPSVTNQANGICLVSSKVQLRDAVHRADEMQRAGDFVIQKYLPPLLLDGRKFHLRVFMLLHGNLTAYVAPDFLAIFSLEQYKGASLDETRAHLTNIAHQEVLSEDDQHRCMRLFEETKQDMIDAGYVSSMEEATERVAEVKKRVYEIIADTVDAVSCELTFQARKNCFELFGLDFMISPDWSVHILEANAEPDLSKAGDRLQCIIDRVLEDTMKIVIDQNSRFSHDPESEAASNDVAMVQVYHRTGRGF